MWVLRGSSISRLESKCGGDAHGCPASATDDIANGKTYSALGIGLFALGAVGVASGAGVLLLGGKGDASPSASLAPTFSAPRSAASSGFGSTTGMTLSGRF